jgi:prepilin-type N-terminal cleavage/methylation domain-containing protein
MRPSALLARKAFTLIEVVASLLLVGTLLVTVMTAHRRLVNQGRLAQERIAAVAALDELLASAQASGVDPLVQIQGKVPGNNPYTWRTSLRDDSAARSLGGSIVRIELYNQKDTTVALATVELLQPGSSSEGR